MGKIRLNLTSGASTEKILMSAFNVDGSSYVILDNEVNGSMGLPIILVCKLDNNKLVKITDQEEWGKVKEYLKNIIAGNNYDYIPLENEISADDIYYTQLTLPVPSFDALKNSYKLESKEEVTMENNSVEANESTNIEISLPSFDDSVQNAENESEYIPVQDINSSMETNNIIEEKNEIPSFEESPNNTNLEDTISFAEAPINLEPTITPTPVIDSNVVPNTIDNEDVFKEQKEAFMQACENMFDALVQKFKKELDNK